MYVIYALIDPWDNKVRYVGMTDDVFKRFQQHISCTSNNLEKNKWMLGLREANVMPIMAELERAEDAGYIRVREAYWINHYIVLQHPIVNIQHGSPRLIKKVLVRSKGVEPSKYLFTEAEKPILINLYNRFHSIEECLKTMKKGARYHKDASRILKDAGLL